MVQAFNEQKHLAAINGKHDALNKLCQCAVIDNFL